jgi:VCBS repeat-containing protein
LAGAARIDAPSADSGPTLTHQTGSPDLQTGIVKGQVIGSDPGGDTLTYSAQRTSAGGGVLDIDAETGDFTFTPTQAQRHAAAESTTDTFIVTAHCGVRTAERTVTVAVDPGIPVAGGPSVSEPSTDTGAVTGSAGFSDTAGRTLTYTAAATSAGGGVVGIDAQTGRFEYTPTQEQRHAATESTADTFVVAAHNGVRTAEQIITVKVLPIGS